jgi:hypothetical protein
MNIKVVTDVSGNFVLSGCDATSIGVRFPKFRSCIIASSSWLEISKKIFRPLKMGTLQFRPLTTVPLHCLEKSVFGYPLTQRRIPEARKRPDTGCACLLAVDCYQGQDYRPM